MSWTEPPPPPPPTESAWSTPPENQGWTAARGPQQESLGVAALACGLLSLPGSCCCAFFGLPLSVAAFVLGFLSISKIRADPEAYQGTTFAWVGIVSGFLGIAFMAVSLLANVGATLLSMMQNM